jgi:hypothetical protein
MFDGALDHVGVIPVEWFEGCVDVRANVGHSVDGLHTPKDLQLSLVVAMSKTLSAIQGALFTAIHVVQHAINHGSFIDGFNDVALPGAVLPAAFVPFELVPTQFGYS